ncbi:hypothetical protein Tco_0193036, partial [Tanacetum coccineum]
MQILSVVRIKAYSIYGYDYLSEIVLRRADFQEHTIAEKDFKNMYPSDFIDLNLLLLQGHLDISHWWFNRQKFYIDRHDSLLRRKDVRTHMQILSVVKIKAYSIYGYDYLSEIVLRRADFQEHTIDEKRFQEPRVEDFQLGIESYQTQLNLTKLRWDAKGFEFKHDYTIIESPRAVVFPVNNNEQKIMRFNEIYKFSD